MEYEIEKDFQQKKFLETKKNRKMGTGIDSIKAVGTVGKTIKKAGVDTTTKSVTVVGKDNQEKTGN